MYRRKVGGAVRNPANFSCWYPCEKIDNKRTVTKKEKSKKEE